MKVLFIENREKTVFWEQVALRLRRGGHEIAWLVQNPAFAPPEFADSSSMHVLAFPPRIRAGASLDEEAFVREKYPGLVSDRGRRYFGAGASHYAHYVAEIERSLNVCRPDLVVGESTLFHELIAIDRCRAAGIPYVQPEANRYPGGRFSLYAYDTQITISGSGESLPDAEARALVERIASGRELPFYMQVPGSLEKALRRGKWALSRGRVWFGRIRGERYNTPSLWRKLSLERRLRANLERWRRLARLPTVPARTLLYPMQIQPEANIDVWGRPYSDQAAIVRELLAVASSDVEIAVKANPKPKYELSEELLQLAERNPRVCLLPLQMSMLESLACVTGAITVTGTVGLEAVFGKGRCLSLCHPIIEKQFPRLHATSLAQAAQRLLSEPSAGLGDAEDGVRLIKHLVARSFAGFVSDPLSYAECLETPNVEAVAQALERPLTASQSEYWESLSISRTLQAAPA